MTATTETQQDPEGIVRALLGDNDIRDRTAAMTAEIEQVAEQTEDLRVRGHALLRECEIREHIARESVKEAIANCQPTITPQMALLEGIQELVSTLSGSNRLHLALTTLGEMFQDAAERRTYPDRVEQEVSE